MLRLTPNGLVKLVSLANTVLRILALRLASEKVIKVFYLIRIRIFNEMKEIK